MYFSIFTVLYIYTILSVSVYNFKPNPQTIIVNERDDFDNILEFALVVSKAGLLKYFVTRSSVEIGYQEPCQDNPCPPSWSWVLE